MAAFFRKYLLTGISMAMILGSCAAKNEGAALPGSLPSKGNENPLDAPPADKESPEEKAPPEDAPPLDAPPDNKEPEEEITMQSIFQIWDSTIGSEDTFFLNDL